MASRFSGENGQSALRWLRALKYELPGDFTPSQWLEYTDGLLEGEAARWADQHPRVKRLMKEESLQAGDGNDEDVKIFEDALKKRFDTKILQEPSKFLEQGHAESLDTYYRRAEARLHALGGVDRNENPTADEEGALVQVIIEYVNGIHDWSLRTFMRRQYEANDKSGAIKFLGLVDYQMLSRTTVKDWNQTSSRVDPSPGGKPNLFSSFAPPSRLFNIPTQTQPPSNPSDNSQPPSGCLVQNPGSQTPQPTSKLSLNSTKPAAASQADFAFRNIRSPATQPPSRFFGNIASTNTNSPNNPFSSRANPATTSGWGFPNMPSSSSTQPPNSLFGNPALNATQPTASFLPTATIAMQSAATSLWRHDGDVFTQHINNLNAKPSSAAEGRNCFTTTSLTKAAVSRESVFSNMNMSTPFKGFSPLPPTRNKTPDPITANPLTQSEQLQQPPQPPQTTIPSTSTSTTNTNSIFPLPSAPSTSSSIPNITQSSNTSPSTPAPPPPIFTFPSPSSATPSATPSAAPPIRPFDNWATSPTRIPVDDVRGDSSQLGESAVGDVVGVGSSVAGVEEGGGEGGIGSAAGGAGARGGDSGAENVDGTKKGDA